MRELEELREQPADELIQQVLHRTGYRLMLLDSQAEEDAERLANIEELITAARQFVEEDSSRTIGDFLENITLASDVDSWDERQDCVSIMTLHAAKGLEFPVVYMLAVEQNILPHERSQRDPEDLEEERRLAFVGMTRAKEELYLCHAKVREFRGQTLYAIPSPFLEELPEEVEHLDLSTGRTGGAIHDWRSGSKDAETGWHDAGVLPRSAATASATAGNATYAEGMLVRHESYGTGRITEVSGYGALRKIRIRFASGERSFIATMAKLEVIRKT
jgi:DNA helicase-2/ATP-dependent DNA helicase PcrA